MKLKSIAKAAVGAALTVGTAMAQDIPVTQNVPRPAVNDFASLLRRAHDEPYYLCYGNPECIRSIKLVQSQWKTNEQALLADPTSEWVAMPVCDVPGGMPRSLTNCVDRPGIWDVKYLTDVITDGVNVFGLPVKIKTEIMCRWEVDLKTNTSTPGDFTKKHWIRK